jgi:hypothetical protein
VSLQPSLGVLLERGHGRSVHKARRIPKRETGLDLLSSERGRLLASLADANPFGLALTFMVNKEPPSAVTFSDLDAHV